MKDMAPTEMLEVVPPSEAHEDGLPPVPMARLECVYRETADEHGTIHIVAEFMPSR